MAIRYIEEGSPLIASPLAPIPNSEDSTPFISKNAQYSFSFTFAVVKGNREMFLALFMASATTL